MTHRMRTGKMKTPTDYPWVLVLGERLDQDTVGFLINTSKSANERTWPVEPPSVHSIERSTRK